MNLALYLTLAGVPFGDCQPSRGDIRVPRVNSRPSPADAASGGATRRGTAAPPCCRDMLDILFYLFVLILVGLAVVAGALLVRSYLTGTSPTAVLFGPRPERRLEVTEHSNVDGRRRLILVRRDDVEHLIMTGGPVDVVIETGIKPVRGRITELVEAPQTAVFTRQPRGLGQAAADS